MREERELPNAPFGRGMPNRLFGGGLAGRGGGMHRALGMPAEKARDARGTVRKLLPYLKESRVALTVTVTAAVIATVCSVSGPRLLGNATTVLVHGITGGRGVDFAALGRILLSLCGLYAASSAFTYLQQYLMAGISQRLVRTLRRDLQAKLSRLPLSFFDSRPHGELMSRMTNDIDSISTTLQQALTQLITSLITIVGTLAMMLLISPILTLIALACLPLAALATSVIARRSRKYFAGQQAALGELTGHVEEAFSGHVAVVAFGRERASIEAFSEVNDRLYRSGVRAQFASALIMPAMQLINNSGYVLVCVVGGAMAARRLLEIGDIQAFLQYLRQFTMPIVQTASIANIIQSTIAAAERVFAILEEKEERADPVISAGAGAGAAQVSRGRGRVRFEGVSFRYRPEVPLIEGLDMDVEPGKLVAIVGPTGAGKTTLVNLLMRFYEVDSGRITVDGVDISALPRREHRARFGMVLQDTWLFHGSILDNIAFGKVGATEEEVIAAARSAQADHFIRTLPEGYRTILDEEGSNLSQGQKQLLTIARAILADPTVLILDEATSSVDTRTELLIQRATRNLMADRTSFVIAHRLSTIRDAALILVMEGGRIVEGGTHRELLARGGAYAELHASQFALVG